MADTEFELFPTKTRLALLRAIDDGEVVFDHRDAVATAFGHRRVTEAVRTLCRVGWARLAPNPDLAQIVSVEVTDIGRAVLDAHPEAVR